MVKFGGIQSTLFVCLNNGGLMKLRVSTAKRGTSHVATVETYGHCEAVFQSR